MTALSLSDLPRPMFISSRLMASLKIGDAGTVQISFVDRDEENRAVYQYVVTDRGTAIHSGDDLRSGVGAPVDYLRTMVALLAFLEHYAEEYRHGESSTIHEWCYLHDTELAGARFDLDPEGVL